MGPIGGKPSIGRSSALAARRKGRYWVRMRAGLLLIPLLTVGCGRTANTFEVHAPESSSAVLHLCGQTTDLERSGEALAATRAITCEGHGVISVRFPNRPPVNCAIGYVTPGMEQSFRFDVDGDRCSPSDV